MRLWIRWQWMMVAAALLCSCQSGTQQAPAARGINGMSTAEQKSENIMIDPAPAEEEMSADYTVAVGGGAVPVYRCRVSAIPFCQVWPGYQRPIDQTELAAFASWEMTRAVEVEVVSHRPVKSVEIKPASRLIRPTVNGNRIRFRMPAAGQITVEVNGWHHALHLFANPPEQDAPKEGDAGVKYFGPGIHRVGKLTLESNQTIYIAGGAVVHGCIQAAGASNIRILGRGILDVSEMERGEGRGAIRISDCTNITIEGVILRDPDLWCCALFGCRKAEIANVKLVGLWRYNADGIDICNSQSVTIRDSFVRAFDDCIVLKGLKPKTNSFDDRPVRDIQVRNCVIWNDWGRAIEIGAETAAPEIADVVFEDCDIIRTCHIALDIQHGDRAVVRDIRFDNIRVEIDDTNLTPRFQKSRDERYEDDGNGSYVPFVMIIDLRKNYYSHDTAQGTVRNIIFHNIAVNSKQLPPSRFNGLDQEHDVQTVRIEGLKFNGRPASNAEQASLSIGQYVRDVSFVP